MKKKTLLILENSVALTGAFRCALNEAALLSDQFRFVFVVPNGSTVLPLLRDKGYPYHTLPYHEISRSAKALLLYPFFLIANLIRLRKIVRQEKAVIIQVNDFYNLLGVLLRCSGSKITLLTYIRFLPSALPKPLRKLWTGAAQRYSHRVITVSDAVLNQLPAHTRTLRLYDPALLAEKHKDPEKHEDLVHCLYIANYTRGKGQEHAIEAFAAAYATDQRLRLKLTGGTMGLEKNLQFREELKERIKALRLGNVAEVDPFSSDVELEIKRADILLNFSEAESFSLTCLEASFYRRPVIATRCGGPEEIIEDGQTGILVPRQDISAMTQAICRLAADPVLRRKMGDTGRKYVSSKFSPENFRDQFQKILTLPE